MRSEPMPTGWPPTRTDSQGREIEWDECGAPRGGAIGGLLVAVLAIAAMIAAYRFGMWVAS